MLIDQRGTGRSSRIDARRIAENPTEEDRDWFPALAESGDWIAAVQDGFVTPPNVEVIDLRSLVPLDREAIVRSVSKTGRLIVVDEDYQSFGLSGEVIAVVAEHDPTLLKRVSRVCVPDVPIPYAHELEYAVLPTPARIEAAVRDAVAK